jgi:hypothetical protein
MAHDPTVCLAPCLDAEISASVLGYPAARDFKPTTPPATSATMLSMSALSHLVRCSLYHSRRWLTTPQFVSLCSNVLPLNRQHCRHVTSRSCPQNPAGCFLWSGNYTQRVGGPISFVVHFIAHTDGSWPCSLSRAMSCCASVLRLNLCARISRHQRSRTDNTAAMLYLARTLGDYARRVSAVPSRSLFTLSLTKTAHHPAVCLVMLKCLAAEPTTLPPRHISLLPSKPSRLFSVERQLHSAHRRRPISFVIHSIAHTDDSRSRSLPHAMSCRQDL